MSAEEQSLPPELDWGQMESGIMEKMEVLQKATPPVKKPSWRGRIFTGLSLIIVILLFPFLCGKGAKDLASNGAAVSHKNIVAGKAEKQNEDFTSSVEIIPSNSINNQKPLNTTNNSFNTTDNSINNQSPLTTIHNTTNDQLTHADYSKNPKIEIGNNESFATTIQAGGNIPTTTNNHYPIVNQLDNKSNARKNNTSVAKTTLISSLPSLENATPVLETKKVLAVISASSILPLRLFLENESDTLVLQMPDNFSSKTPSRFSLLSGISMWDMGYRNTVPERAAYERNRISYQAQLNYIHPLKKNFILSIGLQYQQLESRFDYTETLDNYQITLVDTIVQFQTSALTGQQTAIRGDVDLTVQAERIIRHYNKTQLFQIPFAVGKTWISKKWQADLLLGGSINILSKNKGRTFFAGEIQDYDGAATDFLDNHLKWNAMVGGSVTYQLYKNLGITSGVQFQKSISNWSKESNVQMRPNVLSFQLGVSYIFD